MPHADPTVADIVNEHAGAPSVFDARGIAYWRDGGLAFSAVCADVGLSAPEVLAEIVAAGASLEPAGRWDQRSLADLVEHLVERFHQPSVAALLTMDKQLRRIGAGRSSAPDYRALRRAFDVFREEYVHHMQMEERIVFRMIRSQVSFIPRVPLRVMRTDHDLTMTRLAQVTEALRALEPSGDEEALDAFRDDVAALGRDLRLHTHLENNVLLPRAFAELDARLGGVP